MAFFISTYLYTPRDFISASLMKTTITLFAILLNYFSFSQEPDSNNHGAIYFKLSNYDSLKHHSLKATFSFTSKNHKFSFRSTLGEFFHEKNRFIKMLPAGNYDLVMRIKQHCEIRIHKIIINIDRISFVHIEFHDKRSLFRIKRISEDYFVPKQSCG